MLKSFDIFSINSEAAFNSLAIEIFLYQYDNNLVYRRFVDLLSLDCKKIHNYRQIPFLPIEFFKTNKIIDKHFSPELYFQSSGTTSDNLSKHYIANEAIYKKSILKSFSMFFGDPSEYIYLGLLPSYLERNNSSLIYMVDHLMKQSNKVENGYYLHNFNELYLILNRLEKENKKVILFGVSYALLDFASSYPIDLNNTIIIETGGMKGRKVEITKDELLSKLKFSFQTDKIYSEYSMTELLSQAYSLSNNIYQCPPWMKILIRDVDDPFEYVEAHRSGGVNIIDLVNIYSCSFISTQDIGKDEGNNCFKILGRMDNSDIRGCSLLLL
ncbi:Acyl-protein synthetase, LuxE [Apibacter mensalis]|uniref:Acyl-protein synthetase, LuxE n=1 Tax=Apibacter mensalis TaxID=1586267 RepID=A0A0X3ANW8_9FLAO|nr:acyltransferase [Apibacter mensalis]CVK16839.1 Acyl-protein synthetase, LuxE [Apibacter mensalis]